MIKQVPIKKTARGLSGHLAAFFILPTLLLGEGHLVQQALALDELLYYEYDVTYVQ